MFDSTQAFFHLPSLKHLVLHASVEDDDVHGVRQLVQNTADRLDEPGAMQLVAIGVGHCLFLNNNEIKG
jgi:hypothetical protein